MIPCSSCQRHIRADEARCPFCAMALRVEPPPSPLLAHVGALIASLVVVGTTACAPDTTSASSSTGEGATTETTGDPTGETSTSAGEEDDTEDPPDTSGSFYAPPEDFGDISECDPFMQDCPEGEKCIPFSNAGTDIPDKNKCVPVIGDSQPGEACTFQNWEFPSDSCGVDSFCYPNGEGPDTGTCKAFCGGTADDPICEDGSGCVIAYEGSLNLCMADCDPLLQDCANAEICVWNTFDAHVCAAPLVEPQAVGEPCEIFNDCEATSVCVNAGFVLGCEGSACCTPYCDLAEPDTCGPELDCVAFFDPDNPEPPPIENLGVCVVPEGP